MAADCGGLRESCLRAHFDALRLFGVLPLSYAGCVGSGVASLAVLVPRHRQSHCCRNC
jgi:hypothetical protein